MEGANQKGSSSKTNDVVGAKGSSSEPKSSTSGIFHSLFPPPTKEPFHFLETPNRKDQGNGTRVGSDKEKDSFFQDEKAHPFNYNSSIYYGGQDVFIQPPPAQKPVVTTPFNEEGVDDANFASRGNWWQGSLYY